MKRTLHALATSFLLLAACAQPRYENSLSSLAGTGQGQKGETCAAKFSASSCVSITWEKTPTEEDFGSFLFKTYRSNVGDGSPVAQDLGRMNVVLWMPAMNHGSSPVSVERLDVGTFRASNVFFSMRGPWEIQVQVRESDALKDQANIPFTF